MVIAGIISVQSNIRRFTQKAKYNRIQHERAVAAAKIQSLFRSNIYFDVGANRFQSVLYAIVEVVSNLLPLHPQPGLHSFIGEYNIMPELCASMACEAKCSEIETAAKTTSDGNHHSIKMERIYCEM